MNIEKYRYEKSVNIPIQNNLNSSEYFIASRGKNSAPPPHLRLKNIVDSLLQKNFNLLQRGSRGLRRVTACPMFLFCFCHIEKI